MTTDPNNSNVPDIASTLPNLGVLPNPVQVILSHELVNLLSEQLYQSPLKAIEELVVNAFDAEATECWIYVPDNQPTSKEVVAVFDNGIGMTEDGLRDLWQIGRSKKRDSTIPRKRKQIGKFGIGKLATNSIANQLTYISRSINEVDGSSKILTLTVNYNHFTSLPADQVNKISIPVYEILDWMDFKNTPSLTNVFSLLTLNPDKLITDEYKTWTLVILENLKAEKLGKLISGNLKWVLETAMPLASDFKVYLNGNLLVSTKENHLKVVEFSLADLPLKRLDSLKEHTEEEWKIKDGKLISDSFPSGISGDVFVTKQTLTGKSDDIARSYGFFIYVLDRLVNQDNPLFVSKALIHAIFNRFRANIKADDLDPVLKASRETLEESPLKSKFSVVLREVFNEAYARYNNWYKQQSQPKPNEKDRDAVQARLTSYPIADALITNQLNPTGAEADGSWFYMDFPDEVNQIVADLYSKPTKYRYNYTEKGNSSRFVSFEPETLTFWLNLDHELVQEYSTEGSSRQLLEDLATAEAMLEIYLYESHVPNYIIGGILERRDLLLRDLVRDHTYSPKTIANMLREASADDNKLEIALVVAARALGFVASHIAGPGKEDGLAKFNESPSVEKTITLEAKASATTPSLSQLDFAGLRQHMTDNKAAGCLLVAPSYPGETLGNSSTAAHRGIEQGISCWKITQLARVVEAIETHQINATDILNIVLNKFAPDDVDKAVDQLLSIEKRDNPALYQAIIKALRETENKVTDRARSVTMISVALAYQPSFNSVKADTVKASVLTMAEASQGGMTLSDETIILHVSIDELERRLSSLLKQAGTPRIISRFRYYDDA